MATKKPATIGNMIDSLWKIREAKKALAEKEKELNAQIEALETELYARMDSEESTSGAGKLASVTLGETDIVQFAPDVGYDEFIKYVAKTKSYHLLERRISQVAAREVYALKNKLPGTTVFTKRKINLTTKTPK